MPLVCVAAVFTPDEEGVVTNCSGAQARLVDGELVPLGTGGLSENSLGSISVDDIGRNTYWPAFDQTVTYDVSVDDDGDVVVVVCIDYDEDSPWDEW